MRQRIGTGSIAESACFLVSHFIYRYKTMSYQDQLSPWVVYRQLPNLQRLEVARFRRRNDAEEDLKIVQRLTPLAQFEIVYDVRQDEQCFELGEGHETVYDRAFQAQY